MSTDVYAFGWHFGECQTDRIIDEFVVVHQTRLFTATYTVVVVAGLWSFWIRLTRMEWKLFSKSMMTIVIIITMAMTMIIWGDRLIQRFAWCWTYKSWYTHKENGQNDDWAHGLWLYIAYQMPTWWFYGF